VKPHIISLGTTLVIAAAIGLLSYRDWNTYDDLAQAAEHARTVVDQTENLLSLLKDAEAGQRGYLLTGDERYLAPYQAALPGIAEHLEQLKHHQAETGPPQAAAILSQLVREELAELANTIEIRRRGDLEGALAVVRTNLGIATMDQVRATAGELISAEDEIFRSRQSAARKRSTQTRIIVLGGAAIMAILLIGAVIHVTVLIAHLERSRLQEQGQKATLHATLRSIGDAVVASDTRGVITFINPAAEQVTGWRSDDATGRPLTDIFRIINEATREAIDNPADKVLRDGAVVGLANHTLLLTRDGREVPIDDSGAPIQDPSGKINGVVLVFRDVSARRQAERDLEESEKRYRLLFENNPQPMWVYEQQTLRFLAVNNAAVQNYGYTRAQFLGMTLRDIRPKEDIPKLLEVTAVPATSLRTEGAWRHQKKDGTVITVEITEHPLTFDNREACLVLASDITERKSLEQQFHQAQKLDSVGRLAGGVAHDFNNLLTVINGYCEMLLSDVSEESPLHERLKEIRSAGDRAASLTQQLLAFSRRQIVQPTVVNLNLVVGEIQKMLRRLIGEDIDFISKLSPDLWNITADAGQLQQVIMNLVVNARDAMPNGGTLMIETSNITFDENYASTHAATRPGPHVMLAVSDTGCGMTPEVKERLFEPFFTTKPTGAGTGLGLATVYGMVKQSGGWIWVYTELGRGTTFKVYFPRADSPLTQPEPLLHGDSHGSESILVVEDQTEVRNLAVTALRKCGYVVHSAANGAEAISFSRQFKGILHLLLTDVIMPGMNGREVADELRKERPTLVILFMSGYTENAIAHRGVLDAGIDYLQKPFTPEILTARVRQVLGRSSKNSTILVVDDHEEILKLLGTILSQAGYAVLEAGNGKQAMEQLARSAGVDLVIMDIVMPEQEGLETLQMLHRDRPTLKVIVISGAFGGGYLDVAEKLGAKATLRKPIEKDQLLQTVREVLNQK
jgi:two-component system cell cycle sensor histidine kinase/response regulator CckA